MANDTKPHPFAPPLRALSDGFVVSTPDLDATLLREGYARGLFPWTDNPVGWFCPAERALIVPHALRLPSNFAKLMRKSGFVVRADTDFEGVMRLCRRVHAQAGEWITERFVTAYCALFAEGYAHSVEIYRDEVLVGGLYGVHMGTLFAAESMFALADNAGKAALWFTCAAAARLGVRVMDVQVLGRATASFGAIVVPRAQYLALLPTLVPHGPQQPAPGSWQPHADFAVASSFPVRS